MENCGFVNCNLHQEVQQKPEDGFCKEGLWLYGGELLDFKSAFRQIYEDSKQDHPKDLSINKME
jgi:hypothetical protein